MPSPAAPVAYSGVVLIDNTDLTSDGPAQGVDDADDMIMLADACSPWRTALSNVHAVTRSTSCRESPTTPTRATPQERTASTHWAVVIGVSDYIHFDDTEGGDLPAAQHDAMGVRDGLVLKHGFPTLLVA